MKRARPPIGIGILTVLMLLVTLLLCSFSVLSLLSAKADARLTDKAVAAVLAYYDADTQAENKVNAIEKALQGGSGWQRRVESLGVSVSIDHNRAILHFSILQGGQSLQVSLEIPLKNGTPSGPFVRTGWQMVTK